MTALPIIGRCIRRLIQFLIMLVFASYFMFFAIINGVGILSWQ